MFYITLDLEWNQAYAQKALAVQRQLSSRLRGEVIQIGAVKLDKKAEKVEVKAEPVEEKKSVSVKKGPAIAEKVVE